MDTPTVTLVVGLVTGFVGIVTAGMTCWATIRSKNQELAAKRLEIKQKDAELAIKRANDEATIAHQLREELRADKDALRKEVAECREEIARLRSEVERLTSDLEANADGRERAEQACERLKLEKRDIERARKAAQDDALEWQKRYQTEHDLVNSLSLLYDAAVSQRTPDTILLATIEDKLRVAGLLSKPVEPPFAVPSTI